MRRLAIPPRDTVADYDRARTHRNPPRPELLAAVRPAVIAAYATYSLSSHSDAPPAALALAPATSEALRTNFDLLDADRPLHDLRADVLAAAAAIFGRCPMCEVGRSSAIDHYLPRTRYPEFAILVVNLIPVCERCNRLKDQSCVGYDGKLFFHCYFDEPTQHPVVQVELTIGWSVAVEYQLDTDSGADDLAYRKISTHFDTFSLWSQYQEEASAELVDSAPGFHEVFSVGGPAALRQFLKAERDARVSRSGVNNWEAALYRALAATPEFYEGGYQTLLVE